MTDRVFIRHPDQPERNGYVSQTAYDALWSKKGFEIAEPTAAGPSADELNAELDRRAGINTGPPAEPVPPPTDEPPEDEKARLTAQLEGAGVPVDRRWGIKRLRAEAANLGTDEDFDE